jgi:beta-lactamase superfamily II metal-dependent hydrolase
MNKNSKKNQVTARKKNMPATTKKAVERSSEAKIDPAILIGSPTTNADTMTTNCMIMGDVLRSTFMQSGDIRRAEAAIKAYNSAVNIAKVQLIHKKMSGDRNKIPFLQ